MIRESDEYYRYDGTVWRCELTYQVCDRDTIKRNCRSCMIPFYMWMRENGVRE
jgi:hypothetical protein